MTETKKCWSFHIMMFFVGMNSNSQNWSFNRYHSAVHGISSNPKKQMSKLSSSTPSPKFGTFGSFVFAENDVCVKPSVFVCSSSSRSNGSSVVKDDDQPKELLVNKFRMRNVPGDGDCMFQAVALCTSTSMGLGGNASLLRSVASETRYVVAQILANPKGVLHVQGKRLVRARDLLRSAAMEENLTPAEYIQQILDHKLQGGGPELTVLSNVLRRPISIYEITDYNVTSRDGDTSTTNTCHIQCVGCFGDYFQDPCSAIPNSAVLSKGLQPGAYSWHIHILVVDSGNNQKHACALLPEIPTAQ